MQDYKAYYFAITLKSDDLWITSSLFRAIHNKITSRKVRVSISFPGYVKSKNPSEVSLGSQFYLIGDKNSLERLIGFASISEHKGILSISEIQTAPSNAEVVIFQRVRIKRDDSGYFPMIVMKSNSNSQQWRMFIDRKKVEGRDVNSLPFNSYGLSSEKSPTLVWTVGGIQ